MRFYVRFQREFVMVIDTDSIEMAERLVRDDLKRFAEPTKLLSILPEGYVEPAPTPPPRGRPNGDGSPGTPVVKKEILVDQIAEAA